MIAILTLIATLDCTQPRVRFAPFFEAHTGYRLVEPPPQMQAGLHALDMAYYLGQFADYVVDYNAKCGSSK